jgi:hypothetical protein
MKNLLIVVVLSAATMFTAMDAQASKPKATKPSASHGAKVTKDITMPKNVKPREIRQETHPSGRKDTYAGQKRNPDGSMAKPHGHTIQRPDGKIEYARTPDGKVLKDSGAHVDKGTGKK